MDWIFFIRLIILITFLLILAWDVTAIVFIRRFYARYVTKHRELEKRLEAAEGRLRVLEGIT